VYRLLLFTVHISVLVALVNLLLKKMMMMMMMILDSGSARDRPTDDSHQHLMSPSPYGGGGITNSCAT